MRRHLNGLYNSSGKQTSVGIYRKQLSTEKHGHPSKVSPASKYTVKLKVI